MSRKPATSTLKSLLIAAVAAICLAWTSAAKASEASPDQAKHRSANAAPTGSSEAGAAPRKGPPLFELGTREKGREYRGQRAAHIPHRKGLAVIADFSNARLEDWDGPGFTNTDQISHQLRLMEWHWAWLSRGLESFHWDIIRITLPVELSPDAYAGWVDYRDAVAQLIRQNVDVSEYDANKTASSTRHG